MDDIPETFGKYFNILYEKGTYLDKFGGAYESYRDKQTAEIKQITLQMKDL